MVLCPMRGVAKLLVCPLQASGTLACTQIPSDFKRASIQMGGALGFKIRACNVFLALICNVFPLSTCMISGQQLSDRVKAREVTDDQQYIYVFTCSIVHARQEFYFTLPDAGAQKVPCSLSMTPCNNNGEDTR
jgi:hypothetical protein